MSDWIDQIAEERSRGIRRPLLQSQHADVNARHPGMTVKRCEWCGAEIDDAQTVCSDDCARALEEAQ